MNPIISVIVPVYRVEKFLQRAVESMRRQTFSAWEMILVDDGSPDQCGELCECYAACDSRIRAVHQENQGVSAARNTGLDLARGNFVYFLDPDDYLLPETLQTLYETMRERQADIVMAGHDRIEIDGRIHRDYPDWPTLQTTEEIQRAILRNDLPNFVWGKLYTMEMWRRTRFPKGLTVEDLYILPEVFYRAKKIVILPQTLYIYSHENEASIMSGSAQSYIRLHYHRFLAWEKHEQIAAANCPAERYFCAGKALHAAVRAVMLNMGQQFIAPDEVRRMAAYVETHEGAAEKKWDEFGAYLIKTKSTCLLQLLGKGQRYIAERQQRRRIRRRK